MLQGIRWPMQTYEERTIVDEIVKQAMTKWPDVPDCFGWLGLDSRGQWYLRDDAVQAIGGFQSGFCGAKGSRLQHEKLIKYIERNYEADQSGRWYFQNGPQRVFIELENTPFIWRLDRDLIPISSTGVKTAAMTCLVDETGRVYLHTTLGIGLVHTLDVMFVAEALDTGAWHTEVCFSKDLETQFGFVRSPKANQQRIGA